MTAEPDPEFNACARRFAADHLTVVASSGTRMRMASDGTGSYVGSVLAERLREHWLYVTDIGLCAVDRNSLGRPLANVFARTYGGFVRLSRVRRTPEGPVLVFQLDRSGILNP